MDAFPILDHRAIVVVAKSTWQALQATRQLQTTQDPGASKNVDSDQVRNQFVGAVTQGGGIALLLGKDVSDRVSSAAQKKEEVYHVPLLPHVTLEPMNASAARKNDIWHIWAPTQFAEGALSTAARTLHTHEKNISLHTTFCGGGFGRRVCSDFVAEVAAICEALGGRAVKLTWTRESDFKHDFYRPAAAHKISAGVSAQGISAWSQWVASQSVTASIATDLLGGLTPDKIKKNPILTVFGRVGSKVLNKLPIDPFKVEGAL